MGEAKNIYFTCLKAALTRDRDASWTLLDYFEAGVASKPELRLNARRKLFTLWASVR